MPTDSLPDNPDIDQLKGNARTLRDLVRAGFPEPVELVREHHPRFPDLAVETPESTSFKLVDAQLTLARHYGFASWAKLHRHVEVVNDLTRAPHVQPIGQNPADDDARADELLRLACLNYGADEPDRWRRAARLLADQPHLGSASIHTAAAVGDWVAASVVLADDPSAASRQGGPFAWEPLLYLTYSRLDLGVDQDHVGVARLLLDQGADPNAGYLWEGLPSPFTALTGVFGRGEQGAPPHHQEMALARLLLEAGAEANDSQTIYNRGLGDLATDDTGFLELLLDFGLGRGDGGPWRRLLGPAHHSPGDLVAEALQHAAEAGLIERARLLLARGADPNRPGLHPGFAGRHPYEGAVLHGNLEMAELLGAAGADTSTVDSLTRFVGACLSGDGDAVDAALAADATLLDRALEGRADLVARAAELGRPGAVRLLSELGFDVNARRRTTALHEAALRGDLAVVEVLMALGGDPSIVDTEFDSTPRGWADHNGQVAVVEYFDHRNPPA